MLLIVLNLESQIGVGVARGWAYSADISYGIYGTEVGVDPLPHEGY